MVSKTLIKFSSPFAKSCLIAIGAALTVDAILIIFAARSYPYLIPHADELYIQTSSFITIMYSSIGAATLLLALSTGWASYKSKTNFLLVHSCITGVFLPVSILVYFSSLSSRYKVSESASDFKQMIADYRLTNQQLKAIDPVTTTPNPTGVTVIANVGASKVATSEADSKAQVRKFNSFINIIDSIQSYFVCCGIESSGDWSSQWNKYIPPSCCNPGFQLRAANDEWSTLFKVDSNQEFIYCPEDKAHQLGCLLALKDDEKQKFAWLADLIIFLMIMTITNTIITLLLIGLSKTEDMPYDVDENELAMVGVSTKPRPSQPEITGIRHRPSVIAMGASKEQIATISQAVRFNLSNSPRTSISGPSRFSAGARRSSSHV